MAIKEVSFLNSRGQKLSGIVRYTDPVEPKRYPVVVVLHGFAEHKHHDLTADIANMLVTYGFLTLRFDFHGHGDSEGEFEEHTIHQQVDDVFAALDFATGLDYADPDRLFVVGTDIGGNIALLAAAKDARIKGVVCQGARSHFDKHINSHFQQHEIAEMMDRGLFENQRFRIRKEYVRSARMHDILDDVKNVHCPVLFVHGTGDMRVTLSETRELFGAANEPKALEEVEGADHWFREALHRTGLIELIVRWLRIRVM
ncbi:alpha/beta fold hydrolase [Candidatus Woesearchaeota archaeon]|nr:alpha/beta fold hydrolase [Candidatus Woesearchaeota archaeon]